MKDIIKINIHWIIIGLIILIGFISSFFNKKEDIKPINNYSTYNKPENFNFLKQESLSLKEKLIREIKYLKGDEFEGFEYNENNSSDLIFTKIIMEYNFLYNLSSLVVEGQSSNDREINKLANELKNIISNIQIEEFPKMRTSYIKSLKRTFWEDEVKEVLSGSNYTSLYLDGDLLCINNHREKLNKSLFDMMNKLRFKQIIFNCSLGSNKMFFKFNTPNDSELIK